MFAEFTQWMIDFGKNFLTWFYNILIDFIQAIIDAVPSVITTIVSLFPASTPFPNLVTTPTGQTFVAFMSTLNWIAPIGFFVTAAAFMAFAITAYWIIAPVARWFKLLT